MFEGFTGASYDIRLCYLNSLTFTMDTCTLNARRLRDNSVYLMTTTPLVLGTPLFSGRINVRSLILVSYYCLSLVISLRII